MIKRTLLLLFTLLPISSALADAKKCDALLGLTDFTTAVEPGVIVPADEAVPAHCRVRGVIDSIRFEVTPPVTGWQGRFMFHAVGGSAGRIGDTTSLLAEGFAQASTDTGHEGTGPEDNHFYRDQNALINWGSRGVRLTTLLAKRIIAAYYGEAAEHSYIWGCSNGGRAGLEEALRYPEDYDGVIAGAPAPGWASELVSWSVAGSRQQQTGPLTLASLDLLDANSLARCDDLDGLADGVVSDPQACTTEILQLEGLQCGDGGGENCLTKGQVETARFMYDGIMDESGKQISPGVSPGAEGHGDWMLWVTGNPAFMPDSAQKASSELVSHLLHREHGFNLAQYDPVRDRHKLAAAAAAAELPPPDFSRFRERGGKLIVYNGWNDVPIRAGKTLAFMSEAEQLSGGRKAMKAFSRLYMVPGMLHCGGGPGAWAADYITPMVNWVEKGKAPFRLIATQPGITNWFEAAGVIGNTSRWGRAAVQAGTAREDVRRFTRPLCPYPLQPRYDGKGNPDEAASFSCVTRSD